MTGRNDTERLCLIVNPRSAGGATSRRMDDLREAADRWFAQWELRVTEGPRHATDLATRAVEEGFDVVAAVGGDGTASETCNGLFDEDRPRSDKVVFTVIPAGTGSDLVRSLRVPRDVDEALRTAAHGDTRASDVAHVRTTDMDGEEHGRICVNLCGFGANGAVVHNVNQSSKRLGGTITFLSATLAAMRQYRPQPAHVTWDGPDGPGEWDGEVMSAFIANGAYCGGGMWMGSSVSMQDGVLDLVMVPRMSMARMAVHTRRLYTGTIGEVDGVVQARVTELTAESRGGPIRIDVDGEDPGVLPLRVKVLPGVLWMRGRWPKMDG